MVFKVSRDLCLEDNKMTYPYFISYKVVSHARNADMLFGIVIYAVDEAEAGRMFTILFKDDFEYRSIQSIEKIGVFDCNLHMIEGFARVKEDFDLA